MLVTEAPLGDLGVRKWRFDNGLHALLCRDARAPVVAYQSWVRVGSRDERPGKTGLAHLFEHLMFNETENLPAGEFDRRIEAVGGDTNASTWVDWTCYQTNVGREHLALVAELEAERLARLVLREPQVVCEREVVANERRFRVEDDIDGFLGEQIYRTVFREHPYRWPTIGWMDDIRSFTPEDCASFYRTHYAPNHVTLVVVGDFGEDRALALIERHYGPLPPREAPRDPPPPEPRQTEERRAAFRRSTTSARLTVGWLGPPLAHVDHPAIDVLNEVLFGGRSSRLWTRLVVGEVAASAGGSTASFRDAGPYEIGVTLKRGRTAAEAEAIVDEEVARLRDEPVAATEIDKARARLESGFLWSLRGTAGKARALGHFETTTGDFRDLLRVAEAYRRVSAEDVQRVAGAYLRPDAKCVVAVAPTAEA